MFSVFFASAAPPDRSDVELVDVEAVDRWRLVCVRQIGYVSAGLCALAALAEYVLSGAGVLPNLYCVNAVILVTLASGVTADTRATLERVAIVGLLLTSLASILLTGRLMHASFLAIFVYFTSIYEEAPAWRRAWVYIHGAAFASVSAYFASAGEVPAGPSSYYECIVPGALTVTVLAFLLHMYIGISRRVFSANASLNDELAERVADARVTETELQAKLTARRRVTASIAQSVENAHLTRARLEASHEQLQQFAYAASHDLKEPVRTIKSFMRMAQLKMPAEAAADVELAEQFDFIQSNAEAMHEVLDRLLVYSRATRLAPCPKPACVQRAWQQAIVRVGLPNAALQGHLAALGSSSTPVPLVTDPVKLQLVLVELLSNAVRFAAPGQAPAFVIEIDPPTATHVTTRITDRGIGFDPAYTEQVFGLFRRLHPREQYASAGVGLAIVRRVAQQLNAEVRIDTVAGEGTTVALTLPLALDTQSCTPTA